MMVRHVGMVLSSILLLSSGLHAQEASTGTFALRTQYVSHSRAVLLSALFPGLGQLATGHRYRGTALVAAEMACLVVSLTSHEDYETQRVQFKYEKDRYLSLREGGSFQEAEESWERLSDKQDEVDGSHLRRRIFGALAAVVYGYNLVDVLLLGGGQRVVEPSLSLVPRADPRAPGIALVARF